MQFIEALPESFRPQFLKGENVDLTEWIYSHSDDSLSDFECRVLPFLESGYVVGGCSRAPDGVSAEQIRTLWIDKVSCTTSSIKQGKPQRKRLWPLPSLLGQRPARRTVWGSLWDLRL